MSYGLNVEMHKQVSLKLHFIILRSRTAEKELGFASPCMILSLFSYYLHSVYTLKQFCFFQALSITDLHPISMHLYVSSLHFILMYHNLFDFAL